MTRPGSEAGLASEWPGKCGHYTRIQIRQLYLRLFVRLEGCLDAALPRTDEIPTDHRALRVFGAPEGPRGEKLLMATSRSGLQDGDPVRVGGGFLHGTGLDPERSDANRESGMGFRVGLALAFTACFGIPQTGVARRALPLAREKSSCLDPRAPASLLPLPSFETVLRQCDPHAPARLEPSQCQNHIRARASARTIRYLPSWIPDHFDL